MLKVFNKKNSTLKIIALSYVLLIFAGALILIIPAATKSGKSINFFDALFTATSSICVTGIMLFDTFTHFSLLGQLTILVLIQIGGIGFMTVASIFLMITGRKIGLWSRGALTESISAFQVGGIVKLVRRVVIGTLIFEVFGAILLAIRFCPDLGVGTGIYYAIFHSISAFCNAGFDLMGRFSEYSSLMPYKTDILVNLTVSFLVIVGGIGFVVWNDIFENKFKFSQYKLHSKIVLISTLVLIVCGTFIFYIFERNFSMANDSENNKWLISFFQSVMTRTAGFSTVDVSTLSEGGTFFIIIFMLIGGSPGSTAGGIKTTTIVIILISAISYLKNNEDVNIFKRRLDKNTSKRAFSTLVFYLFFILTGIIIILISQNLPLEKVMFEIVSAISTTGMLTSIAADLNVVPKIVIMLLMFIGRIGSLTFASIFANYNAEKINTRFPEEKVTIG
jgi:trk system potassium uptake protein TrkH